MMTSGVLPRRLGLCALLPLLVSILVAQTNTGSIAGTVADPSAAVIAGARLTLTNTSTGEKRSAASSDTGSFLFPALPPGAYELAAERDGFKRAVRAGIHLSVQDALSFDIVLTVGSVSESVEVQATALALETATSSLGQVIDNRKILDLPLNGRNTLALVALTPGVQPMGGFGGLPATGNAYGQGNFSVSGSRGLATEVILDGAPVNASLFSAPAFIPSVDAVEEFKVQTNNFSAEFGRTGGGVVNVVMKSGTNQYHGNLYEFFRNRVLDANGFFANASARPKAVYVYNVFGGTIGGPVSIPKLVDGKDKTFFFFGYEGLRQRNGVSTLTTLPTTLQRSGDFSATKNSAGQLINIYDPLTTVATGTNTYARSPFPNNRIPDNRIDPVSRKLVTFYPTPNLPGDPVSGVNNFFTAAGATNLADQYNTRIDHVLARHRLFGRYSYNNAERGAANYFGNDFGGVNPTGGNVPILVRGQQFVLRDTYTATPTLIADFSYGVIRQFVFKEPLSSGKNLTDLGFSSAFNNLLPERYYPNFSITNFYGLTGSNGDLIRRGDYTHSFSGTATKLAGRHTLKFGGEYRLIRTNDYQPSAALGFSFGPQWTQGNPRQVASNSGFGLATFLLGAADSGSHNIGPAMAMQNHYTGFFLQDDIRLSSKLTINLGLRYELETPRTERYDRLNWFDTTAASPLAAPAGVPNLTGGLVFAGVGGNGRQQMALDTNNLSPRFGFAWSGAPKTVIRGGYGIFYSPLTGYGLGAQLGSGGYSTSTSMVTSRDSNLTPADFLSNPFPQGLNLPPGSSQGLATLAGQSLNGVEYNNVIGYTQQWNFDIQRELPAGLLADLAYVGSHSLKTPEFWEMNQMNPSLYTLGAALQDQVTNPFAKVIDRGPLAATTVSRTQLLRPYPQFQSISTLLFASNANYHSVQAKLERRMANGLSFLAAYTFSKAIGDSNQLVNWLGDTVTGTQNNFNRRAERALLPYDVSQRLVTNVTFALPFGRGHAIGSQWGKALDLIAGGWQLNGIGTFQTGVPLVMGLNAANPFGGSRPNSTGASAELDSSQRTIARWFDTTAFTQPPAYSLGNVSRTLPDVRGYNTKNFDLSIFKVLSLTERVKLQIRGEAFNAFNRTRFGNPNTAFGSPNFGRITSAGDPRQIQLAMKLNF
jgi:hypothetical protein